MKTENTSEVTILINEEMVISISKTTVQGWLYTVV